MGSLKQNCLMIFSTSCGTSSYLSSPELEALLLAGCSVGLVGKESVDSRFIELESEAQLFSQMDW